MRRFLCVLTLGTIATTAAVALAPPPVHTECFDLYWMRCTSHTECVMICTPICGNANAVAAEFAEMCYPDQFDEGYQFCDEDPTQPVQPCWEEWSCQASQIVCQTDPSQFKCINLNLIRTGSAPRYKVSSPC